MPTATRKYLLTPEEVERVENELGKMLEDDNFNTLSSYIASTEVYSDHQIPFVQKHMAYLRSHPKVNPDQYLSNLRMMTKIRA
jgi:hypothetical protein